MAKTVDLKLIISTAGSEKTIEEANQNLTDLKNTLKTIDSEGKTAFGKDLQNAIQQTTNNIDGLTEAVQTGGVKIEDTFKGGKETVEEFSKTGIRGLGALKKELAKLNDELETLPEGSDKFKELTREVKKTEAAIIRSESALGDAGDKLKTLSGSGVERLRASFDLVKEGILNLDFGKVKTGVQGASTAFGGLKTAIAATGIGLLILAITQIIANFDKLKESGGAVGAVFTAIGKVVTFLTQGAKDLLDTLGLTDSKASEAKAAEEEYGNAIRETNNAVGKARRDQLVLSGKLSQAEADRVTAKEKFITDFIAIQEETRTKLKEAGSEAARKKIIELGQAQTAKLSEEYKLDLINIRKSEKEKADEIKKTNAETSKELSDNAAEKRKERLEKEKENLDAFNKLILDKLNEGLSEEDKIRSRQNEERRTATLAFEALTLEQQKAQRENYNNQIKEIDLQADADITAAIKAQDDATQAEYNAEADAKKKVRQETQLALDIKFAKLQKEAIDEAGGELPLDATIQQQIEKLEAQKEVELSYVDETSKEAAEIRDRYEKQVDDLKIKRQDAFFARSRNLLNQANTLNNAINTLQNQRAKGNAELEKKYAKQQFNRSKALGIVEAGINTATAITKALPNPITVAYAAVVGALQIAAIAGQKFDDQAGGGATPDAPAPPADLVGGGSTAPQGSISNQQIGAINQTGFKVFVTETDITSVINKVDVIESQSKFG
jgi:hypothetical protein